MSEKRYRFTAKDRKFIREVRFTGEDFFQSVIGCCVFCLSAFLTPDLWNFIESLWVRDIALFHIFFVIVVFIAFNYEYASKVFLSKLYMFEFGKRMVFVYLSVFFTIIAILFLIRKITLGLPVIEIWKNFLSSQTIGIASAVTFSFLKR